MSTQRLVQGCFCLVRTRKEHHFHVHFLQGLNKKRPTPTNEPKTCPLIPDNDEDKTWNQTQKTFEGLFACRHGTLSEERHPTNEATCSLQSGSWWRYTVARSGVGPLYTCLPCTATQFRRGHLIDLSTSPSDKRYILLERSHFVSAI